MKSLKNDEFSDQKSTKIFLIGSHSFLKIKIVFEYKFCSKRNKQSFANSSITYMLKFDKHFTFFAFFFGFSLLHKSWVANLVNITIKIPETYCL